MPKHNVLYFMVYDRNIFKRLIEVCRMAKNGRRRNKSFIRERNAKAMEFLPFIVYLAKKLWDRLPPNVSYMDLFQAGFLGMMDAIERYDAGRGTSLRTHIGMRATKRMIDEVRGADFWITNDGRREQKRFVAKHEEAQKYFRRKPSSEEMADFLGITIERYHLLRARYSVEFKSIQEARGDQRESYLNPERIVDRKVKTPLEILLSEELRRVVQGELETLSFREYASLRPFAEEGVLQKDVGKRLGVSSSRVCQVASGAKQKLRHRKNLTELIDTAG